VNRDIRGCDDTTKGLAEVFDLKHQRPPVVLV